MIKKHLVDLGLYNTFLEAYERVLEAKERLIELIQENDLDFKNISPKDIKWFVEKLKKTKTGSFQKDALDERKSFENAESVFIEPSRVSFDLPTEESLRE